VRLEASTKPHVHGKFEMFWTNIASTMDYPNFKNGPKNGLGPLGVRWKVVSCAMGMTAVTTSRNNCNTELAIHALDQVHCWGAYFRPGIDHYENFTPLNFQPLLFSKQ
jgi:hypothetical protein